MNSATLATSPPDPAADATSVRHLAIAQFSDDASVALSQVRLQIRICAAGQEIARLVDAPDIAGANALVIPLQHLRLGRNARWNPSQDAILSAIAGQVCISGNVVSVEDTLELNDDIDAGAGAIHFPGHVVLQRNILDQAKITADGNMIVHGAIEAADVAVGGDLLVDHGICGKTRGQVRAKGKLDARFLSNAHAESGADVVVGNEIANSRVLAAGRLVADKAAILSSRVTAIDGISCDSAGSTAGFRTMLELGMNPAALPNLQSKLAELNVKRGRAADIRSKVEPLLKNQKGLTAAQKEKATELLFLADEADLEAQQISAALKDPARQLDAILHADIRIATVLHQNVTLRCLGYETVTTTALRGPIRVSLRISAGQAQFVIADAHNKNIGTLPAVATEACATIRQILATTC